jgi:hypothetical protein
MVQEDLSILDAARAEPALDEPHGLFDRHAFATVNRDEDDWDDDEVAEPEFPPSAGLGSGEERAHGTQDVFGAGITSAGPAIRRGFRQAKAQFFPISFGTAEAMP